MLSYAERTAEAVCDALSYQDTLEDVPPVHLQFPTDADPDSLVIESLRSNRELDRQEAESMVC